MMIFPLRPSFNSIVSSASTFVKRSALGSYFLITSSVLSQSPKLGFVFCVTRIGDDSQHLIIPAGRLLSLEKKRLPGISLLSDFNSSIQEEQVHSRKVHSITYPGNQPQIPSFNVPNSPSLNKLNQVFLRTNHVKPRLRFLIKACSIIQIYY